MVNRSYFRVTLVVFLLVLALWIVACAGDMGTTEAPSPTLTATSESMATAEPEAGENEDMTQTLWDDLQAANYPEAWETVPGKGMLYPGQGPHGMLLSTYLNPEAMEALQNMPGQMPEGGVIVKENYSGEEELKSVTVMHKQPGFDPDHGDWFWAKYAPDGTVQAAGRAAGCISCHYAVRSNDYVFSFPIAPMEAEAVEPTEEVMSMAQTLWDDLQAANYPEAWETVPGKGTLYPGQGPHGALLSTYLNPDAMEALQNMPGRIPEGGIIVKENYSGEEELKSVTVMHKQPGFDPDHRDWFWAKYAPDGTVQAAGQAAGCISCHGAVSSNDYIFTFPIEMLSRRG